MIILLPILLCQERTPHVCMKQPRVFRSSAYRRRHDTSRGPAEGGVPPVEVLDLFLRQARQLLLNRAGLALLVVPLHPQEGQDAEDQDGAGRGEVQAVADGVVGAVPAEKRPGGDEAADVAKHDCSRVGSAHGTSERLARELF